MNYKVYMLMFGGIPAKPTGLATSVIRRSNVFSKNNIENEILVHNWYIDYDESINYLQDHNKLHPKSKVRFMYNELAGDSQRDNRTVIKHSPDELGWVAEKDADKDNVYRCFKDGLYLKFKWYAEEGHLKFIDYLLPNFTREKREWYDSKGYVRKIEYMDYSTNTPARITYINKKGKCYLSILKNPKNNKIIQIHLFDDLGGIKGKFSNELDLVEYWLENYVLTMSNSYQYLISEYAVNRRPLQRLENKTANLKVIYTIHSSHLGSPYTFGSEIRNDLRDFFNHLHEYSGVVFLTEEQKQDIIREFGESKKYYAIPHHAPIIDKSHITRDPYKVVTVGRFEKMKNQDHVIKAFQRVIKKVPQARLELYGRGSQEEYLRSLINELNLQNYVTIKGFSDDVYNVFYQSSISIVPSDYEGICLSLMESMSAGCVPISYDFKYGPKDVVQNGLDGLIVQKGNIEVLSEAIIDLLLNSDKREAMSSEATKIVERFSEERLAQEWKELFETIR
ncbi:glycosyltransferase [Bacillus altitudinis]|uniref:glycosyltransferase n=1 Tax=Bacillus TaxID=1386 RepID=UPI00148EADA3|nr:glycosyltransferase [Bacillus altitudinis]MBY0184632.1 glycosyltransferase [Bacillus aerophilus]MCW4359227.1 glycosyltransferase [Bacillus altitudinis]MCY7580510.1 glycosyltransferase [Bacillus altitudinis]MCY7593838.1 glycosyltransferase [Bacillus altitudinis]MCY7630493.1 glycosyltransferase [Bacillus altitudinis]